MTPTSGEFIEWDIGTAYDFFISLSVLHEPEHFGLRGSWAAGVRSRLPGPERELLQRAMAMIWPFRWLHGLPAPKDASTALAALRGLEGTRRLFALAPNPPETVAELWTNVAARGAWNETDAARLTAEMQKADWKRKPTAAVGKVAAELLDLWTDASGSADGLLSAYDCYYAEFFAEEEGRIRPALDAALARAQSLARRLPQDQLLEEISQGVRMAEREMENTLVLAPSFWATPLVLLADLSPGKKLFLFGARPSDQSLVPGDVVPDALHQALKALADPTRLRILRYLTDEATTPAELARRLRLRSPTVIHHLDALRLARLVIVTLEPEGKRYALRPDGVDGVWALLKGFLEGRE